MKRGLIIFLLIISPILLPAQRNVKDSLISFPMIGATGAFQMPGADMKIRFGNNFNIGGVFQWKTRKNFVIGLDGQFLFGNTVHENTILDSITTSQGGIISSNGDFATVFLYERGWKFEIKLGKIFPIIGPNKNSGLFTSFGAGLLQHKIRIENQQSSIPSIEDDYKKGYDRLSNGLSLTGFIGYVNFGNRKLVNFYAGFEFTKAITQNRRSFNFDTREQDLTKRNDLLSGIRLGWVIPIYKRAPKDYYYN